MYNDVIERLTQIAANDDLTAEQFNAVQDAIIALSAAQQKRAVDLPTKSRQPSWADDGLDDAVIGSLP